MIFSLIAAFAAAQSLAQIPVSPAFAPAAENPLARAALDVFTNKCTQCHGPQVPHPKAAFGFITDLPRLVSSGRYIVPGDLASSEIWSQISDGDMPPDNARAGPLIPSETEAIKAWISAGAPPLSAAPPSSQPTDLPKPPEPKPQPAPAHTAVPWFTLLGRLHVIIIHFPIALLIVAAAVEAFQAFRRTTTLSPVPRLLLPLGAAASILSAALGWLHALDGFPGPAADPLSIAGLHRWLGTAAALLASSSAWIIESDARRSRRSLRGRLLLIATAALVAAAAHFGGLLTHGAGFLTP